MPTLKERILSSSRQGMTLRNIKFCRGDREVISEEEFSAQVCSIVDKRADDTNGSQTPTHIDVPTLDVRDFISKF